MSAVLARAPRPPRWLIVLALAITGIELGIHQLPGAGLLICAAVVVAAAHD